MLPIYTATTINKTAMTGGTTLPCIMTVEDDQGEIMGEYVVKVFNQQHVKQYNPTKREFWANILAQEFDLEVPQAALIKVEKPLIAELRADDNYKNISLKEGFYFGCKFIDSCTPFSKELLTSFFDHDTMEQVFAFDVLIRNFDRRLNKPNMLLKNDDIFLIDHDLSLDINKSYEEYKKIGQGYQMVINGAKGQHIFLHHLQLLHKKHNFTFDHFVECLKTLSYKQLNESNRQLNEWLFKDLFDDSIDDFELLIDYLKEIQGKVSNFQALLKELISND